MGKRKIKNKIKVLKNYAVDNRVKNFKLDEDVRQLRARVKLLEVKLEQIDEVLSENIVKNKENK